MKHIVAIVVFGIVILISGCKKTVSPTQAQLTAQKLAEELGQWNGNRPVDAVNTVGSIIYAGSSFSIAGDGHITLSASNQPNKTYNLAFLKAYSISNTAPGYNVRLEFSF